MHYDDFKIEYKNREEIKMMKRIRSMLLIILILLVQTSFAEALEIPHIDGNMELRGGIYFGMTLADVVKFEESKGNVDYETTSSDDKIYTKRIDYTTEIAGVDNNYSHLRYFFDQQDVFVGMGYNFGEGNHPVNGKEIYDEMYATIVQKYGEPKTKDSLISSSVYTQELFDSLYMQALSKSFGSSYSVMDLAQWLVSYDDCYLLIDMHITQYSPSSNPFLNIGYRVFRDSEYQSLIENDIGETEEYNQKRNDDL